MKISDIDANFKLKTSLPVDNIQWFDRFDGAFQIYGTCTPCCVQPFCRMAEDCLGQMSDGVRYLAYNTAGVRLRFRTDSAFIAVKARLATSEDMSHMARSGSSGFDLYCGCGRNVHYRQTFMPEAASDIVVGEYAFANAGMRDVSLNFPLYNGITTLEIGLQTGASVECATPYRHAKPVVFYGSSITQGGCASRPGNAYQMMLSRLLDTDIINLGFSGSARGEQEVSGYIASLDMSVFVMDYDHNAPNAQHLRDTHFDFYSAIRSAHLGLPIVMLSRPDFDLDSPDDAARRCVVFDTYRRALDAGDRDVYFIDGERMFGAFLRDSCTVDGCHPNDLGFMRMAEAIYPTLERLLG